VSALSKYQEAITECPCRGGGLHQYILKIASLGVLSELTPDQILADCSGLDGLRPNEMEQAINKAFKTVSSDYEPIAPRPISRFAPKMVNALDSFISKIDDGVIELMDMSPISLHGDPDADGDLTLRTLYKPTDSLFIGDVFDRDVKTVGEWLKQPLGKYPHIIPNPMTGDVGMTTEAKMSYRCEQTVKELRYAVCEMDEVPLVKQVKFWIKCISIGVPVSAVIHSGSKSLHGWVKVNCGSDGEKWEKDVRGWLFGEFGKAYGLDPACSNRARVSRLPGHQREGKQQQRLLYLNGEI
jgi:hypothetical protein